jgi:hypothetical protein
VCVFACLCVLFRLEKSRGFHGNLVERGDAALGSAEPADRTPRARGRAESCEERGSLRKRRHAPGSPSCGHGKGARPADACRCMTVGSNQRSRSVGFGEIPPRVRQGQFVRLHTLSASVGIKHEISCVRRDPCSATVPYSPRRWCVNVIASVTSLFQGREITHHGAHCSRQHSALCRHPSAHGRRPRWFGRLCVCPSVQDPAGQHKSFPGLPPCPVSPRQRDPGRKTCAQIEHSSEAILASRPRPRALLRVSPLLLLLLVSPPSAPSPVAPASLSPICRLRGGYGMMDEDAGAASAFGSVPMKAGKLPPSVPVVNSYLRAGRIKVCGTLAPPPRPSNHMLSSHSLSSLVPQSPPWSMEFPRQETSLVPSLCPLCHTISNLRPQPPCLPDDVCPRDQQAISQSEFLVATGDKLVMVTASGAVDDAVGEGDGKKSMGPTIDIGTLSSSDCYSHPKGGGGISEVAYHRSWRPLLPFLTPASPSRPTSTPRLLPSAMITASRPWTPVWV